MRSSRVVARLWLLLFVEIRTENGAPVLRVLELSGTVDPIK